MDQPNTQIVHDNIPSTDNSPSTHPNQSQTSEEGSILLPKISLGSNEQSSKPKKKRKLSKKVKVLLLSILMLFVVIGSTASLFGYLGYQVYKDGLVLKDSLFRVKFAAETQNLGLLKEELIVSRKSLSNLQGSYSKFLWIKPLPYVGAYVADGEHALNSAGLSFDAADILLATIEPYADIIGLSEGGDQASSGVETAQDRLDFVVSTIPDLIPKADELSEVVAKIDKELNYIDPNRYPEEYKGIKVREKMKEGLELVDMGAKFIETGKPLLAVAPDILGTENERTYLILFQNDKELRPTGGFLTAYSIASVKKGKFEPVISDDIYNIDAKYTPVKKAPDPIVRYIKGPYVLSRNLRLRDFNWSPDYGVSMEEFLAEASKIGIKDIDGIIAVDTQLLVNILKVIGPIGVSGFGNYSTEIDSRCNCPQVIYELESFADNEGPIIWDPLTGEILQAPPNYDNRKKIIGPLMNSILSNALGQTSEKIPALFQAGFKSVLEKHVLVYLTDENEQNAVVDFGIAGSIRNYEGDYLMVNDANLGGRKSNLYVTQEVSQEIVIEDDGTVIKNVDITYTNPEKHDGWLNSTLPNWLRVYVPKGSELIDFEGVEDVEDTYEELDKTVFAGYLEVRPQGVAKVSLKYKLPFKVNSEEYKLLVQKQAGKDAPLYAIKVGKMIEELFLTTDKEFKFKI